MPNSKDPLVARALARAKRGKAGTSTIARLQRAGYDVTLLGGSPGSYDLKVGGGPRDPSQPLRGEAYQGASVDEKREELKRRAFERRRRGRGGARTRARIDAAIRNAPTPSRMSIGTGTNNDPKNKGRSRG